jgi:regulator of protease activity HflC (stomatin/prohibitin superfamily)
MTRHTPNATRYPIAALVAGLVGATGLAGALFLLGIAPPLAGVAGAVLGVTIAASIKYTDQWDRAVLLRLGRYAGLRGPGYFTIIPIVDRIGYLIDQRIRTTAFGAESCLTRDTVPVNVDAIAFWIVQNAERAALEVQDYDEAVILSAQTALRDAIGKHDLAELIQSRVELGHGLQVALAEKMANWGIQVQSVEIRDVIIPAALEDAMSRQAQAERERQARIILGTAETEIAHKFVEAANAYEGHATALNLRAMNMLYESIVKRGSLMVVPSGLADSLNHPSLMGMLGASGLVPKEMPHAVPADGPAAAASGTARPTRREEG